MQEVNIIRSESWLECDLNTIDKILNKTITELVGDNEKIINIEMKTNLNGLSRFWIYTVKIDKAKH